MNAGSEEALAAVGPVAWVDPSGLAKPSDIGALSGRQLLSGLRALVRFALEVRASRPTQPYLAISVDGLSFWRDALAWSLALRGQLPPIVHLHTGATAALSQGRIKRAAAGRLLRRSHVWILAQKFRVGLPPSLTVAVVPNGLDCMSDKHDNGALGDRLVPATSLHLVYLSNRLAAKGVTTAIEVSRRLFLQHGGRIRVTFAGLPMDAAVEIALADLADEHPEEVTVMDGVDADAKCELLGSADILIFPSRYRLEGAPLVVLEAMMHGVTCIVTNHAALPELIGPYGAVADDECAMVEAVNAYLAFDEDEKCQLRADVRTYWCENYSAESYRTRVCEAVARVTDESMS